jgi:PAS domain S-box-containing protein
VGSPRPVASVEGSPDQTSIREGGPSTVRLLLFEPTDSAYAARIEEAAREAGLALRFVGSLEGIPPNATLVGIGPSTAEPLQLARRLRASGAQPHLVFFAASARERDALHAELIRDPFVYSRFELVELPGNRRQLTSRMERIVTQVKRQLHASSSTRRRRPRSRGSASLQRLARKGEHYLAHFLAHTPDAVLATDEGSRIEAWNAAAQRLFGFRSDAALGQHVSFLDVPADQATEGLRLAELVERVFASGQAEQALVWCRTGNGDPVRAAASVAPIRDSQGTTLGVSVIARDDSEYQRVQEALRQANREKDEFLAIMSHELRTPLTSILGYTDMLLRGLSGPLAPMTGRYIGNVRTAGDRLLELVNSLLDYTRLESGVERLELRSVDMARVVARAVDQAQAGARGKSIDLGLVLEQTAPTRVAADEQRLCHVLRNFLSNAVKFTPDGGRVSVKVAADPEARDAVRVSVADSGIGMREDQIPRVWERFYQGDASLTRPYGGMGLGLAIARHLVALHGGSVGAESRGPGLGSTFWFSLPGQRAA